MKNVIKNVLLLIGFMCVAGNVHAMQVKVNVDAKQVAAQLKEAALEGNLDRVEALLPQMNMLDAEFNTFLTDLIGEVNGKLTLEPRDGNLALVEQRLEQERSGLASFKAEQARVAALYQGKNKPAQSGTCILL